jgi:hypothetical protein
MTSASHSEGCCDETFVSCESLIDVRRMTGDLVTIEFDNVTVVISMGLLGALYAAMYTIEAADKD